ncbi:TetR/AcrR family transcriptional regulator [Nocardia takedensis]|uniref:TetR/AcrR family transcriptional regulator n=1 Tax=Nocardia takedensis TaxID=259390 RepID=UPI000305C460|nr:TetR/AcrR family transcriptional regulator [Nocardia takedensis]
MLRDALADLVEERGLDIVTVGEISERARVTRTAFYRHYRDKQHLVDQILTDATAHLAPGTRRDIIETAQCLRRFFDHVAQDEKLFRALLGPRGSPSFAAGLQAAFVSLDTCVTAAPRAADGLTLAVLGAMLTRTTLWWLDNDRPIPSADLAARYLLMVNAVRARAAGAEHVPGVSA